MSKKMTINDIAQLSKTSKTTVSFFLNQKFEKCRMRRGNVFKR